MVQQHSDRQLGADYSVPDLSYMQSGEFKLLYIFRAVFYLVGILTSLGLYRSEIFQEGKRQSTCLPTPLVCVQCIVWNVERLTPFQAMEGGPCTNKLCKSQSCKFADFKNLLDFRTFRNCGNFRIFDLLWTQFLPEIRKYIIFLLTFIGVKVSNLTY